MSKITLLDKEFTLFIPADKIQAEVQSIADRINSELKDEDVIFIGVLNGAFMFASDLLRKINFNVQVSFVKLASYLGTSSSGPVKRLIGINEPLKDKTVVIIDIISKITIKHHLKIKGSSPGRCLLSHCCLPDMYIREPSLIT
jgi:hypoxanthine phosphoribosyltransferase